MRTSTSCVCSTRFECHRFHGSQHESPPLDTKRTNLRVAFPILCREGIDGQNLHAGINAPLNELDERLSAIPVTLR